MPYTHITHTIILSTFVFRCSKHNRRRRRFLLGVGVSFFFDVNVALRRLLLLVPHLHLGLLPLVLGLLDLPPKLGLGGRVVPHAVARLPVPRRVGVETEVLSVVVWTVLEHLAAVAGAAV